MTNHPNRSSYVQLIRKLERISVDSNIDADIRRRVRDEHQHMMVAKQPRRTVMSSASYFNRYGNGAAQAVKQDRAAINAETKDAMDQAQASAKRFIAIWNL